MNHYNVHVYAVVRVKVYAVKAESQKEAARKAIEYLENTGYFERVPFNDDQDSLLKDYENGKLDPELWAMTPILCGYAGDVAGYVVDQWNDQEYAETRDFQPADIEE